MDEIKPRLPEKGEYVRMHGVLIEVRTIHPPIPKPYQEYIFEERYARKELRFKDGQVLQTLSTLNDFYGLGSGEEKAIEELQKTAKDMGLGKSSDVEAVVIREIRQYTAKPKKDKNFYDGIFFDFEHTFTTLKKEEVDVWSSKRGKLNIP